jgi:threonyl-tRNA synthetase
MLCDVLVKFCRSDAGAKREMFPENTCLFVVALLAGGAMTLSHATSSASAVHITLPDGSVRTFDAPVTGFAIAESIGAGLAKAVVAMKVDGVQRDLSEVMNADASVVFLTPKDAEGLDVMRHTLTAQVLALAIKELYPAAKLAIGPTIEHGFYYDVDLDERISPEDLPRIEAKMKEIIARSLPVTREMWPREDAIALFEGRGESYKAELIRLAAAHDTTEAGKISLYRQGAGDTAFVDLCRGPHVPHFAKLPAAFALTKVSGAYWRGDSKNKQLQRVYGIAFADAKQLQAHLTMLEEAEKRDHRKLGRELELFHIQEEAQGQVFWHDKGWTLYRLLEDYIRRTIRADGYIEVKTPMLVDRSLWEKSGHWEKFRENMFTVQDEENVLAIKPMNCPCHVQIFNQGITSYRELPIRMAEFGSCHRNEATGALHGLMRVRAMVQDDAHIFCTEGQIASETARFCRLLQKVYTQLGFASFDVKLATRPDKRAGTDATWDKAESALAEAVREAGLEFDIAAGEGAFYGPKLEFHLKDSIGRSWQCGTLQLDFVLPERLNANYIGEDGAKHRPVMLHRAILGSMERFIGILIENYAGKFPLWLAPQQVVVATITSAQNDYAEEVCQMLNAKGLRAKVDTSSDKISYKVREHSNAKIPVILAVGGREAEERTVAVRRLGSTDQTVMPLDACVAALAEEGRAP